MPATLERMEGHEHVIKIVVEGSYVVDNWLNCYVQAREWIVENSQPVHMILEYRDGKAPHRVIAALPRLGKAQAYFADSEHLVISVIITGQHGFLRRISEIFLRTYPPSTPVHFAETIEEARAIIARERAEIS